MKVKDTDTKPKSTSIPKPTIGHLFLKLLSVFKASILCTLVALILYWTELVIPLGNFTFEISHKKEIVIGFLVGLLIDFILSFYEAELQRDKFEKIIELQNEKIDSLYNESEASNHFSNVINFMLHDDFIELRQDIVKIYSDIIGALQTRIVQIDKTKKNYLSIFLHGHLFEMREYLDRINNHGEHFDYVRFKPYSKDQRIRNEKFNTVYELVINSITDSFFSIDLPPDSLARNDFDKFLKAQTEINEKLLKKHNCKKPNPHFVRIMVYDESHNSPNQIEEFYRCLKKHENLGITVRVMKRNTFETKKTRDGRTIKEYLDDKIECNDFIVIDNKILIKVKIGADQKKEGYEATIKNVSIEAIKNRVLPIVSSDDWSKAFQSKLTTEDNFDNFLQALPQ